MRNYLAQRQLNRPMQNNPYYSIALGGTANLKDFLLHPTASFTSINDRARSGKFLVLRKNYYCFDSPDGKRMMIIL
ncbi:hypothetical protein CS542_05180 [Pedobacter sp. IW39]|nr:hypothetical protein CS542_05180 [Pedobacter sp. IW39]